MPISLYSSPMKYKNPNTGYYETINGISGRGIVDIVLNNDYTLSISFSDNTSIITSPIRGATGNGITSIEKTSTSGLIDTYTITYTDGETTIFTVKNGSFPNFTIGTVTEGANAAATITGTDENPVLNLVLPNANVPTKVSQLQNDSGYLTQHQDISQKLDVTLKGANNGLAELDSNGKIPSSQLPAYVDDVLEYSSISNFPATGETSKIYIALDTNLTYRWSGSNYVEISSSLALGETSSTAYRGDRGKIAYEHAEAKGSAFINGLYKITTNSEGHVTAANIVEKSDITNLGIPAQDTTYESKSAVSGGTDISLVTTGEKYNWNNKYNKPTNGIPITDLEAGAVPVADVQVNSTSILSNGVANIPLAGSSTPGVVQTSNSIGILSNGAIGIIPASYNQIKDGNDANNSLVASRQHASTFYGLAKAAGDTTQSQSDNEVGQYTDDAKAAIQQMLDVTAKDDIPIEKGTAAGAVKTKGFVYNNHAYTTISSGTGSFAEGASTIASGTSAHAEGAQSIASGFAAHAEGDLTVASTIYAHAEGGVTLARNDVAHSEGYFTAAGGVYSHAQGFGGSITARVSKDANSKICSYTDEYAELFDVGQYICFVGTDNNSRIESIDKVNKTITLYDTLPNQANNEQVIIYDLVSSGFAAHAEGECTRATGHASHVSGRFNVPDEIYEIWVPRKEYHVGDKVSFYQVGYVCNTDNTDSSFVSAHWDKVDTNSKHAVIVGNGTANGDRSNAYALDWEGNEYIAGDLYVHADEDSSGGIKVATVNDIPSVPVQDVQVNGTSILSNGTANIPIAGANNLGVVRVRNSYSYGIAITDNDNTIRINPAGTDNIKAGISLYMPIVSATQHTSAFYGLAKAAGDSTQAASENPVGTYTSDAKAAIQQMLGVPSNADVPTQVSELTNDAGFITSAELPTKVSDLTNDAGYLTSHQDISGKANSADLATVATSGSYNDLSNKPSIPTNVSDLTDDSGHYTKPVGGIPASDLAAGVIPTVPVTDVRVNGTSVLNNGVANVQIAHTARYGVMKAATESEAKAGAAAGLAVSTYGQHNSVFYGLAKAAGDTTQSASDNAVGTYTNDAKSAIRTMLSAVGSEDYATANTAGIVQIGAGLRISATGLIWTDMSSSAEIKNGSSNYTLLAPVKQHESAFYGLAKAAGDITQSASNNVVGIYTESAKSAISEMLGGSEAIVGTTPTIIAKAGIRYVCGEVSTLDFTPSATGICDVIFTSGTSPTVLVIPNTVKWPSWFNPTNLDANTTYELNIKDGIYGAVMAWI